MRIILFSLLLITGIDGLGQRVLTYSSLNAAIREGQYDGVMDISQLKKSADFGLGSSDRIATELVLLNDTAWSIPANGMVTVMAAGTRLPFAAGTRFKAEKQMLIDRPVTLDQLQEILDSAIDRNRFAAIRITGSFHTLGYKCYLPQSKPYPPIDSAGIKQFDSTNIAGNIVGFYTPKAIMALNNPNYHFHFINSHRTGGGHVTNMVVGRIKVEWCYADELRVILPPADKLRSIDLNKEK